MDKSNKPEATPAAPVQPVNQSRFAEAALHHNRWSLRIEYNRDKQDFTDPRFLAHVARFLRPGDIIDVRSEDMSYYAELFVHDATNNSARVEVLREKTLQGAVATAGAQMKGYRIAWGGLQEKHRVIRESDGRVLRGGFASEADAILFLQSLTRAQVA
jgi:hypothetical protein